ncbi:MAG: helix-turn-helix transcriptional regulator [Dactylosporangium sp.]|nr:XRE family transcriptional regulator [Dactylosporangium sp.]NNJ61139.1 helix-turn-helix transcriptional regulator [Dactylosporangium sp.]
MDRTGPLLAVIASMLRRERERAGLSLSELAKRAGIAKSTLSQLEAASTNPSIETLWALGVALDIPFSRLVDPQTTPTTVIRAGEGTPIASTQAHVTATLLAACPPGARRDVYVVTAEPAEIRMADPHLPGSVEHLIVVSGRLRTGPVGHPVEVGQGDYAMFAGDVPHLYEGLTAGTSAVLVMEHR